MGCCCHIWAGAPTCYLYMLDKLQKRVCGTVALTHATSLEPLGKCSKLKIFSIDIFLVDVHMNFLNWFHFLFLLVDLTFILIDFRS